MYCVVCKFGSITLFSVQNSCHLLTRCIISPITGHKNISLLDKFHAGYIGCIVTCHVKCRLLACCILSGLDAHCVLLHRAASAQMTKYSPLVDIMSQQLLCRVSSTLRGDTPKPFLPYAHIRCHIVKVYLKTIRFDTLEIIFENTLFRKKKNFLFRIF